MPRHPPNALTTLNRSHCQCSSLVGFGIPILLACARRGSKSDHTDNLAIAARSAPTIWLPFTTRPFRCHRRVRPDCFIGATPSSSLASGLKTSFSRLNPGPRGQATVIRSSIRRHPKVPNNRRSRATSFLPTSNPSTISGRLGHPWFLRNWARTLGRTQYLEASRSIFSSRFMQNRHQAKSRCKLVFLQKTIADQNHSVSTPIDLVELSGIEPLTPCLQSRCSPS